VEFGEEQSMLEYHAAYYPIEDGWYMAKVLDFPGAVSQGRTLRSARRMIRDSLKGLVEYFVEKSQPLPQPDPGVKDPAAVLVETIVLTIRFVVESPDETTKANASLARKRVRLRARGR
jgi:predicted RNase H-like HicB family nuclease